LVLKYHDLTQSLYIYAKIDDRAKQIYFLLALTCSIEWQKPVFASSTPVLINIALAYAK